MDGSVVEFNVQDRPSPVLNGIFEGRNEDDYD